MQCEKELSASKRSFAFIRGPLNRTPLAQRLANLPHRHFHFGARHPREYVAKEPAVLEAFSFELSARTARFDIYDAVLNQAHILMPMPADEVPHAIFHDQLMKREMAAPKLHRDLPERFVKEHELWIAILISREVAREKSI
jgi:hypothetical protein